MLANFDQTPETLGLPRMAVLDEKCVPLDGRLIQCGEKRSLREVYEMCDRLGDPHTPVCHFIFTLLCMHQV